jgi:hypothetical protein
MLFALPFRGPGAGAVPLSLIGKAQQLYRNRIEIMAQTTAFSLAYRRSLANAPFRQRGAGAEELGFEVFDGHGGALSNFARDARQNWELWRRCIAK